VHDYLGIDIDLHLNNNVDDEQDRSSHELYTSEPEFTLEKQSEAVISEFDTHVYENNNLDEDMIYARKHYWNTNSMFTDSPTSAEMSEENVFTSPTVHSVLLAKTKHKKGNLTPKQGMMLGKIGEDSMIKELKTYLQKRYSTKWETQNNQVEDVP
jgi:hypothetical protein